MSMKSNAFVIFGIVLMSAVIALLFQNCGKVHFSSMNESNNSSSICVPGKNLGIWLDDSNQTYLGNIVTYSGTVSAIANYNYYSASAHPINGPTPIGYELHNFFYEGPDGLMLNFYANIDSNDNSTGSADNEFSIKIITSGNNGSDNIILVDDQGDQFDRYVLADMNKYIGNFHYWYNTDGAVIGPFNGENFEIRVQITQAGDLQGARFYSANSTSFNLGQTSDMSYIIRYRDYESCN